MPWFYFPRRRSELHQEGRPRDSAASKHLSSGPFGWLGDLWKANEKDEEEDGGFVAASYLKLLRFSFIFMSTLLLFAIGLILPLNIFGGDLNPDGTPVNTGFIRTTISNVGEDKDYILWVHVALQLLQVPTLFAILYFLLRSIGATDTSFQERGRVEYHTVKLRHLPVEWDEKKLAAKLEKYFPGKIAAVRIAYNLVHLSKIRKDWQTAASRLEILQWEEENTGKVRTVRVADGKPDKRYQKQKDRDGILDEGSLPPAPPKKVSLFTACFHSGVRKMKEADYCKQVMDYNEALFLREQQKHLNRSDSARAKRNTGIAFVTFFDTTSALAFGSRQPIFKQVIHGNSTPNLSRPSMDSTSSTKHDPLLNKLKKVTIDVVGINRKMAVSPEEILWDNLMYTRREQFTLKIATSVIVFFVALLWAIPISILSSFSALAGLPRVGPFFGKLQEDYPQVTSAIESIGSPLLAIASEQLVRGLLTKLAKMEKPHSIAGLEASFSQKYFLFVLCNIFLFQTLFVNGIDAFARLTGEGEDKQTLGDAISSINWSSSAVFYINYLLQKGLIGMLMAFFRVTALVGTLIRRFKAKSPQQKEKANQQNPFRFSVYFGKWAIYISIACLFSTVVPLVVLAAWALYLTRYWADKNNILFVLPKYDSTALRPVRLGFYFISIGLLIGQIFLLNLYGFTMGKMAGGVLLVPIILTSCSFFGIRYIFGVYKERNRPQHLLDYDNAADLPAAYLQPALRPLRVEDQQKEVDFYD